MTFDELVSEIKKCEYFENVFAKGNHDLYFDYVKGKYDEFDIVDAMKDYCNTCERPNRFVLNALIIIGAIEYAILAVSS